MTPVRFLRPVLVTAFAGLAAACGGDAGQAEGAPGRFERWAGHVAAVPVSLDREAPDRSSASALGLRDAEGPRAPLRVEVLEPMDLWAARDAGAAPARAAPVRADEDRQDQDRDAAAVRLVQAAAPVVVPVMVRAVSQAAPERVSAPEPALRPVARPAPGARRMVQIGAYSSEAAARRAWAALGGRTDLSALTPVYETVEVGGRRLVRLKTAAPAEAARAVCAAAGVSDPWCSR